MLLAYLRGLLRPGYEQGLRSRVREECILAVIDKEQRADYNEGLIAMDVSMLSALKAEAVGKHSKRIGEAILKIGNLREGLESGSGSRKLSSIDASVKLFHALEKVGILN